MPYPRSADEGALPAIYGFPERVLTQGHFGRPVVWPYDQDAVHYALFDGEHHLACASVTAEPMPGRAAMMPYHLHSMAVEPAVQGRGLGRQVLAEIVAVVASHGGDLLWATARPPAAGFYGAASRWPRCSGWSRPMR